MLDYQREEIRLAQEWFQVEYKQPLLLSYAGILCTDDQLFFYLR